MTKDGVKRMIRVCIDPECGRRDCYEQCKYFDNICCQDYLCRDALTIIEEQESEIERLKVDYSKLQEQFADYQMASDKEIRAQAKQAKIDVLNELKGRVRTSYVLDDFILGNVVFSKDIDEIIKEVQNGEDKG